MTVGDLFLLIMLLAIITLAVAYLHYKWELYRYKRKGYWDTTGITYTDSAIQVLGWFIAFSGVMFVLSIIITNWNTPI